MLTLGFFWTCFLLVFESQFKAGPVVKTSPSNAGSVGLIPDWGFKPHMPVSPTPPKKKTENKQQKQYRTNSINTLKFFSKKSQPLRGLPWPPSSLWPIPSCDSCIHVSPTPIFPLLFLRIKMQLHGERALCILFMVSSWVWANPGRQWRTGKPGMLQFMRLQRAGHDLVTRQQRYLRHEIESSTWVLDKYLYPKYINEFLPLSLPSSCPCPLSSFSSLKFNIQGKEIRHVMFDA